MAERDWDEVDAFIGGAMIPPDPTLSAALADARRAGLPAIDVAPNQGKLLHLLARMAGARRILEVGTLGGYSTIWLARALPAGGRLLTLELEARHAEVAAANLARAGVGGVVDIRVGPASASLAALVDAGVEPFDFVFLDADKPSNPEYLDRAVELSRPGTVIVVDNVVRQGGLADGASDDANIVGSRRVVTAMGRHPRLDATAVQTVGVKGHDGFAIAVVG